jgi:hypothetical protein
MDRDRNEIVNLIKICTSVNYNFCFFLNGAILH